MSEYAKKEFLRLQQSANLGYSLEEFTFEEHWEEWCARKCRSGEGRFFLGGRFSVRVSFS